MSYFLKRPTHKNTAICDGGSKDEAEPVFIVGCARTGSKIYMHILNSSDEVNISPELHFLAPAWLRRDFRKTIRKRIGSLDKDININKLVNLMYSGDLNGTFWKMMTKRVIEQDLLLHKIKKSDRSFKSIYKILINEHARVRQKKRAGAKFPVYLTYVPKLFEWFPQAKFLHIVRDPRAIYSSQIKKHKKSSDSYFHTVFLRLKFLLYVSISFWQAANIHSKLKNNKDYKMFRYENVINASEKNVKRICRFVGVDFKQEMLHPPVKDSSYTVSQKYGFSKGQEKKWVSHISMCEAKTLQIVNYIPMKKLGYV